MDNRDIFERGGEGLGFLARAADALHITTRPGAIRRALLFDQGDRYDSAKVVESERALRGLGVFRDVVLDTGRVDGRFAVRVTTADGWSTQPQLSFSSAGGSVTWSAGLVEKNLLGTANQVLAVYQKTPDRGLLDLIYTSPGFGFRRATLTTAYVGLSDGVQGFWNYGVPFYETAARASLVTGGAAGDQRVLLFRDGALADSARRRSLILSLGGGVALAASDSDFTRLRLFGQWRLEAFDRYGVPFPAVADSGSAALGVGLELGRTRYAVGEMLDQYGRREDVDISRRLFVGFYVAPRAFGYAPGRGGVGPLVTAQLGAAWLRTFAWVRLTGDGVIGASGVDSGRIEGAVTLMSQRLPRQTVVLHAEGGVAGGVAPGSEFDLWLYFNGPRAFGAHVFTGTRRYWLVAEDRILVTRDFLSLVGLGVAPFVEWGGAWYGDERPRAAGDFGLALRLGATRSTRGEVTEIAFARRFGGGNVPAGWALSIRQAVDFRR